MNDSGPLTESELALLGALQASQQLPPDALDKALALRRERPDLQRALLETGAIDQKALATLMAEAGLETADPSVGRYQLGEELGQGGMARVYQAHDPQLQRDVALKLLDDSQDPARFLQEARLAARLAHRHIIQIHEVSSEAPHYIAMALVDGPTLDEARDWLTLEQRMELLTQVADAIGHAHRQGVIHRDLKPSNVLLAEPDHAVVTDFGLARDVEAQTRLTRTGAMLGTLAYMAPEQVLGEQTGPPTDVWALGVMLYELLSDRRPFTAESGQNIYDQILAADPPAPPGPESLKAVCKKAMSRDPQDRYPHGLAFAAELHRWELGVPVRAAEASRLQRLRQAFRRRPWLGLLLLALLALAVGIGAWRARRKSAPPPPRRPAAPVEGPRVVERTKARELAAFRREIQETHAAFYIARASMRGNLARLEARLARWQKRLEREPESAQAEAWGLLGIGWQLAGWPERAEPCLQAARRHAPGDGWVNSALARLYLERAMTALLTAGQSRALPASGRWSREARRLLEPAGRWSGGQPIDRHVALAYQALAEGRYERLRALCREGLRRFDGQPGREQYLVLQGWAAPADQRLALWAQALAVRPHHPWLSFARGLVLLHRGQPGDALRDIQTALALHPHQARTWLARGMTQQQLGRVAAARADYDTALGLDPTLALAYNNRGILSYQAGRYPEAIADYDLALEHRPSMALALNNRGLARVRQGKLTLAIRDYSEALRHDPRYAQAYENRGVAYRHLGQQRSAAADFGRALRQDPRRLSSWINRGACRLLLKEVRGAIADFSRALEIDPGHATARFNRARARALIGDVDGALEDLNRLVEHTPRDPRSLSERGLLLGQHLGRHKEAIADYDRAIAIKRDFADAHYNRGIAHRALGKLPQAIEDFSRAIEHDPQHAMAYNNRGTAYVAQGKLGEAVADYDHALSINPSLHATYFNRGNALRKLGRRQRALADYQTVTSLKPGWWRGWTHMGAMLGMLGRKAEATAALQRGLALAPEEVRPKLRKLIATLQR